MTYLPTVNMGIGTMPANPSAPHTIYSDGVQKTEDGLCKVLTKDCSAGGTITLTQDQTQGYGAYHLTGTPGTDFNLVLDTTTNVAKPSFMVWNQTGKNATVKCGSGTTTVVVADTVAAECRMMSANSIVPATGGVLTAFEYTVILSRGNITSITLSAVLERYVAAVAWTLPATTSSPAGAVQGYADVAAVTTATDFDIKKNGSSVATVRFAVGSQTPTLICASDVAFAVGNRCDIVAPSSLHSMTGALGFTILGHRG